MGPSMHKILSIDTFVIVGTVNAHERRWFFSEERNSVFMCIFFLCSQLLSIDLLHFTLHDKMVPGGMIVVKGFLKRKKARLKAREILTSPFTPTSTPMGVLLEKLLGDVRSSLTT